MHRRTREVRNSETTMKVQNPNPSQEENGGGAYQGLLPVRTQATSARARTKTGGAQSKIEPPLARIRRGSGARGRAPPSGRSTAACSRSGERARRRGAGGGLLPAMAAAARSDPRKDQGRTGKKRKKRGSRSGPGVLAWLRSGDRRWWQRRRRTRTRQGKGGRMPV